MDVKHRFWKMCNLNQQKWFWFGIVSAVVWGVWDWSQGSMSWESVRASSGFCKWVLRGFWMRTCCCTGIWFWVDTLDTMETNSCCVLLSPRLSSCRPHIHTLLSEWKGDLRPLTGQPSACKGAWAPLLYAPSTVTDRIRIRCVSTSDCNAQGSKVYVYTHPLCTSAMECSWEHMESFNGRFLAWEGAIPRIVVNSSRWPRKSGRRLHLNLVHSELIGCQL